MSFQFGFTADVGSDDDEAVPLHDVRDSAAVDGPEIPAAMHKLEDLLAHLPERLSYSTIRIASPMGKCVSLPRRELFDIKLQLLQDISADNDRVVEQIDKSDLRSGIYEGGFKTWECSIDLASLLLDRGPRKDIDELTQCDQIVELGCGTALPSLTLFQHALLNNMEGLTFTFADFNEEVLRLVTIPNVLLTWAACTENSGYPNPDSANNSEDQDLEVTADLIKRFIADLLARNIKLNFLSGPWSSALAKLIPESAPDGGFVVLAAETIYSPASTDAFVDLLILLLSRVKMAKAMIAAKRMYFGVGGSVDGLKEACRERGAVAYEIENHGVSGMNGGVGRALVEVQMF
ncbi:related to MNI1 Putative S-adenosylmethionine-dependent methyltransferase of the seven beta-strand family [Ramularia collo-cygni]|uniref:protein-histidine N-methyltransferase n=1 Tax=Ramularia collo-cygni TaxID=112498 RepID=A0A2D3UTT8_9PEZI|nr:related to MNI1 Putative S-adenosylmethionine-dependent methyltransferase of the seven beta-strand family [Ramularia collo-cygni]CZT17365.1 related to MNI1 Putative S-adenosylmethionine-dependent methyltransferase of the seven beta-strand family [Ramularia collo-cygni]